MPAAFVFSWCAGLYLALSSAIVLIADIVAEGEAATESGPLNPPRNPFPTMPTAAPTGPNLGRYPATGVTTLDGPVSPQIRHRAMRRCFSRKTLAYANRYSGPRYPPS